MKINKSKFYSIYFFIIISAFQLFYSCDNSEEKFSPIKQDMVESVYASVIIQPDSLYNVHSIVSGILEFNFVKEGDLVNKNDLLLQISNTTPLLNTKNAKLAFNLAKENYEGSAAILDGIKDEIIAADLKFKNDSINYFRQKRLWDKGIGSNIEFDAKKLNFRLSKNNLQLLEGKYNRTKKELLSILQQAENNYKSSKNNTEDFTIKSAITGKVYELSKMPGEIVSNFESLAIIGSANFFIIEMLIDEVDIVKIKENQQVIISLDAYKDEVFEGEISKIYPKKDERNQTFKVDAIFTKSPSKLYPGLSGEANIIIGTKKDVLTIPKIYLTENNEIKTSNGLKKVITGLQNMEFIEVVSGISENTIIYKPK
ncbi:HlyD family efflux transporter periplasmic adaptor subunit [uncultured Lutibacter sp.]|uniref:efflux RND transporter periplasmic adaptor subunit n=1 Tax=uncultured Lutibacter sp. TaxID=437739 RepID=UPI002624E804|nr:HlyD family efflux transporter periplasmic adaptor subunit [uncultured Lutibacter sp.]